MNKAKRLLRISAVTVVSGTLFWFPVRAGATGLSLPVGVVYESNFYPQFGLCASVAHELLLKGHPRMSVSVTTSRLSAFAGIDAGFTRFNLEDEERFALLKNRAGMFNVHAGVTSSLLGGTLRPSIDGGIALVSSSTVFPLFFSIGVAYDVAKGVLP